jgi:predicted nuclease of predicted toxin-antitoxin system
MLRFIVDTQLPPSLIVKLNEWGFDAIHTTHFNNGHLLSDSNIRKIAIDQDRIIITKDTDFWEYYLVKNSPPKVFLLELGNIKNETLFHIIEANTQSLIDLFINQKANLVICQSNKLIAY